jgi:hypothetical protein
MKFRMPAIRAMDQESRIRAYSDRFVGRASDIMLPKLVIEQARWHRLDKYM